MVSNSLVEAATSPALSKNAQGLTQEHAGLEAAFAQFNRLSQHFFDAYRCLENQVESLNGQLDSIHQDKHNRAEAYSDLATRYKHLLKSLPVAVIVLDGRGIISEANSRAVELLSDVLVGRPWKAVVAEEFRPGVQDGHEVSLIDGRLFRIETKALAPAPGQIIVMSDLTETRRLQSMHSRQQRLTALGNMMASLCHQVRTPLASAVLYAQHLQSSPLDQATRTRFQDKIVERLQNVERQIQSTLKFVRGDSLVRKILAVSDLLKTLQSLSDIYARDTQFVVSWDAEVKEMAILASGDDLVGAIANLCDNALQAMNRQSLPERKITIHLTHRDDYLIISVSDTGCGLHSDVKNKIFEPFYTTKSQGTGLGLSIVKTVVSQHQGEVTMNSEPGHGTCFCIKLPVHQPINTANAVSISAGVKV